MTAFHTLSGEPPLVIGHRGASAYLPGAHAGGLPARHPARRRLHRAGPGADQDGHLIARHENELERHHRRLDPAGIRRPADHQDHGRQPRPAGSPRTSPSPRSRRSSPSERIPEIRPGNTAYDGLSACRRSTRSWRWCARRRRGPGREIGIIPETKHPVFFEYEGRSSAAADRHGHQPDAGGHAGGRGFTDPDRVFIQSFELANLIELQTRIMPAAGVDRR